MSRFRETYESFLFCFFVCLFVCLIVCLFVCLFVFHVKCDLLNICGPRFCIAIIRDFRIKVLISGELQQFLLPPKIKMRTGR